MVCVSVVCGVCVRVCVVCACVCGVCVCGAARSPTFVCLQGEVEFGEDERHVRRRL